MRICLVSHGFPPEERTGVETYTESLAIELVAAGHGVEVFTPQVDSDQADLAMRREVRPEGFGVTHIATNQAPRDPVEALDPPGVAQRFGDWLDRERPEIVHFQHVIKLGLGLVEAAHERGIPTVLTAHDYFGLCHRYTLLRPDLAVCPDPAGEDVCARCDLATAVLNDAQGLGDYQMGVLPGSLPGELAKRLRGVLDGDPVEDGGFDAGEWSAAKSRRAILDERRREVFRSFDLRLAPSQFLADHLEASGVGKVECLPNGIVAADLVGLKKSAPVGQGEELRIAYIGGLAKHKGVDVLLDAFEFLSRSAPGRARLAIHGYSSDTVHVAHLEARAREVGAEWRGGYERAELPAILGEVDLVVVPSVWYENYPIAIREAFAAGRPVVASRLGALGESVVDGQDGRLFEAGSAQDLARVLEELTAPGEVAALAKNIAPVHEMRAQALELAKRYALEIRAGAKRRARAEGLARLPASLRPFLENVAKLERAPLRELFQEVTAGIGQLGSRLGVDPEAMRGDRLLARAFSEGDAAQRSLRDLRREATWVQGVLGDRDSTIRSLEGQLELAGGTRAALDSKIAWLEESLVGERKTKQALAAERDELQQAATGSAEQIEWLTGLRTALEAERDELQQAATGSAEHIEWLTGLRTALEAERDEFQLAAIDSAEQFEWLEKLRAKLEVERDGLQKQLAEQNQQLTHRDELLAEQAVALGSSGQRELDLIAGLEEERRLRLELERALHDRLHEAAEEGLQALQRQEHVLIQELRPLFEALDRVSGHRSGGSTEAIQRGLGELVEAVTSALERLGTLEEELLWRREQMIAVRAESTRPLLKWILGRSGFAKRMAGWEDPR